MAVGRGSVEGEMVWATVQVDTGGALQFVQCLASSDCKVCSRSQSGQYIEQHGQMIVGGGGVVVVDGEWWVDGGYVAGITPKKVATIKGGMETPRIGAARLMNQLGRKGVIRKKRMYR